MLSKNAKKPYINTLFILSVIIGSVIILAVAMMIIQSKYSHKIAEISFSVSTGPVSPQYQQTSTLTISKDSCQLSVKKQIDTDTKYTDCQIQPGKFSEIQKSLIAYGGVDKIISQKPSSEPPLGGKQFTISVRYNDGSTFTTDANPIFANSIRPFLDDVTLYVPEFSNLGF